MADKPGASAGGSKNSSSSNKGSAPRGATRVSGAAGASAGASGQRPKKPISNSTPVGKAKNSSYKSGSGTQLPNSGKSAIAAWGVVGLVLVIVIVLIVVKLSQSPANNSSSSVQGPVSPSVLADLTNIPLSVYNSVGISSPTNTVTPPKVVSGLSPFTFVGSNGRKLPGVFYFGAEFCPYCAAERWAFIAATSRFGTWSGLQTMESSSTDVYANTPTFTFVNAKFSSPYIAVNTVEAEDRNHNSLQQLNTQESNLVSQGDSSTYFGGSPTNYPAFPFLSFGNKVLQLSSSFTPSILDGKTRTQIAGGLRNPSNTTTQAIVATANYLTASICAITKDQPAAVCNSRGVVLASHALSLSHAKQSTNLKSKA